MSLSARRRRKAASMSRSSFSSAKTASSRRCRRGGVCMKTGSIAAYLAAIAFLCGAIPSRAAEPLQLPAYLSDRGDGIPTSLFGTYIREKEFLFYPFYEYTRTPNFEYEPTELGFTGNKEFEGGKLVEREALVFFAYAFTDSLAIG